MRHRLVPAAPQPRGFSLGVTVRRTGAQVTRRDPADGAAPPTPSSAITGPFLIPISGAWSCTWIVHLRGTGPDDVVEWAATWDDQESLPTSAGFDEQIEPEEPVQLFNSYTGFLTGITIYATVNGVVYTAEPVSCAV